MSPRALTMLIAGAALGGATGGAAAGCADKPPADSAPPGGVETADDTLRGALQFALPLRERELFELVLGVDHDPEVHEGAEELICTNYAGQPWPWCYDEHDGSDYILEGSWEVMDAGSAHILAAADGVVVDTDDGHYDRCHGDPATLDVSCDGHPIEANYVVVEHEGGYLTRYWHMMKDSVAVEVGQSVRCGDVLGLVGSSGYSSMPHLHFEVQSASGEIIDPYAGPYSQPETWWVEQGDDYDDLPGGDCAD